MENGNWIYIEKKLFECDFMYGGFGGMVESRDAMGVAATIIPQPKARNPIALHTQDYLQLCIIQYSISFILCSP